MLAAAVARAAVHLHQLLLLLLLSTIGRLKADNTGMPGKWPTSGVSDVQFRTVGVSDVQLYGVGHAL